MCYPFHTVREALWFCFLLVNSRYTCKVVAWQAVMGVTVAEIVLERFAYAPDGTFGRLHLPRGSVFYTVERPWLRNKAFESCIPDGVYTLEKRRSPVVERTSAGDYVEGWEVQDVPGRSYIMLHPGNWPKDFAGCIGVGLAYQVIDGLNAVGQSRAAFAQVMGALDGRHHWTLDVRPYFMDYP